jgi:HNH endonuclease
MSPLSKNALREAAGECCAWCGKGGVQLTDDHIFPRSIGGTKELAVPSCDSCQSSFSLAEREFARASVYAIYVADSGPRGRDKRKLSSGVIRTKYLLVRHPLGGYGETGLRAGAGIGEALPHIEINVNGRAEARRRGKQPEDIDRLIKAVRTVLSRSPDHSSLVRKIPVRTDDLGDIANDSDFWPRIVLNLDNRLFIRARDLPEARKFLSIFLPAMKAGAFKDQGRWIRSEVTAGTVHTVRLRYDYQKIRRVITKIALGLVYLRVGRSTLWDTLFGRMRAAMINDQPTTDMPAIGQVSELGTINFWPDHHVSSVYVLKDRLRGIVSIYGDCQVIDLGSWEQRDSFKSIVAFCKKDGSRAFLIDEEQRGEITEALNRHISNTTNVSFDARSGSFDN